MSIQEKSFIKAIESKFTMLPGEELIFAQRKHWSTFAFPIIVMSIFGLVVISILALSFNILGHYTLQLATFITFLFVFLESLALRAILDWYFNIYVLTTRRIIEISYSPLASHKINQVLLDQVRCTEIDTKIEGIVNDLLNIGHVIITFDRPTHQEELVLEYVKDPRKIENCLQRVLYKSSYTPTYSPPSYGVNSAIQSNGIYNRSTKDPTRWTYMEDLGKVLERGEAWTI